ncbi:hypothetical protein EC988_002896, partial [Linderina pennispora]
SGMADIQHWNEMWSLFKDLNAALWMYALPEYSESWADHFAYRVLGLFLWMESKPLEQQFTADSVQATILWAHIALHLVHQSVVGDFDYPDSQGLLDLFHYYLQPGRQTPYGIISGVACVLGWAARWDDTCKGMWWVQDSGYSEMCYLSQHICISDISCVYHCILDCLELKQNRILSGIDSDQAFGPDTKGAASSDNSGSSILASILGCSDAEIERQSQLLFSHKIKQQAFTQHGIDTPYAWDYTRMIAWQSEVGELVDYLVVALCMVSGAATSTTDLASIQVQDVSTCPPGELSGNSTLVILMGLEKKVPMALPHRIANVLLHYLVFIRPCEQAVAAALVSSEESKSWVTHRHQQYLLIKRGMRVGEGDISGIFARVWSNESRLKLALDDYWRVAWSFAVALLHKELSLERVAQICGSLSGKCQNPAPERAGFYEELCVSKLWNTLLESYSDQG